jgi:hypothetical protein
VPIACHEQRLTEKANRLQVSRSGNAATITDAGPGFGEELFLFQGKEFRAGISVIG